MGGVNNDPLFQAFQEEANDFAKYLAVTIRGIAFEMGTSGLISVNEWQANTIALQVFHCAKVHPENFAVILQLLGLLHNFVHTKCPEGKTFADRFAVAILHLQQTLDDYRDWYASSLLHMQQQQQQLQEQVQEASRIPGIPNYALRMPTLPQRAPLADTHNLQEDADESPQKWRVVFQGEKK